MPLVLAARYVATSLTARSRGPLELLEEARLDLRVHPGDCDMYLHVNNGRYLSLMDLGRIDYVARCGLAPLFRERGWKPVAGGATIRFRRELRMFTRYSLTTRVAGWNDGWWFFEQVFSRADGALAARAYVKVAMLDDAGKRLPPAVVVEALGIDPVSPELPAGLLTWQTTDHG